MSTDPHSSTPHPSTPHPVPGSFEDDLAAAARRVAEQERQEAAERQRRSVRSWRHGRHPVSVGHLVMGLVFVIFALEWTLVASGLVDGEQLRWLLPLPWVVAGAVGLTVSALTSARQRA